MQYNETIVVPVILAIVELAKGLGFPRKFAAIASVVLGILIGVFFIDPNDIRSGIFKGIVYGLTASGLYSGAKNTMQQLRSKNGRRV